MSERTKKAREFFESGYNCSQSVFAAYADIFGISREVALKISEGFGGGVGRMREVCGTVSGAVMVIGLKYGEGEVNPLNKKLCYEKVRQYTDEFKKSNPSIICRELLGLSKKPEAATPEERTDTYYKKRPCADLVEISAEALEKIIFGEEKAE